MRSRSTALGVIMMVTMFVIGCLLVARRQAVRLGADVPGRARRRRVGVLATRDRRSCSAVFKVCSWTRRSSTRRWRISLEPRAVHGPRRIEPFAVSAARAVRPDHHLGHDPARDRLRSHRQSVARSSAAYSACSMWIRRMLLRRRYGQPCPDRAGTTTSATRRCPTRVASRST